ncbi:MAG: imidazole glycerol phosphate synthase subunit HisH [Gemmatimonadaceae bacterium]|nr:imidazole glycerol phosphate synthase subunit HisH [Gloeobacterales cyanobacterium ES-bin-141]
MSKTVAKIALVDYGVGNLHSARKGLEAMGAEVCISADPRVFESAAGVVLPGVGAFDAAVSRLVEMDLAAPLKELAARGKPLLGICLGMQVLFDSSEEGQQPGLGILPGRVRRFQDEPDLTIPHMGWNRLHFDQPECLLWNGLPEGSWVYFVHSYYVEPVEKHDTAASTVHGTQRFSAAVARGAVWAVQFHPEKSAQTGLHILRNFIHLAST